MHGAVRRASVPPDKNSFRRAEQTATAFPVTHSLHEALYTSQGVLCATHTHTHTVSLMCALFISFTLLFKSTQYEKELKLLIALHVLQGAKKRPFGCSQSAHTSPAPRASQVEGGGWHPSNPAGSFHTLLRSSTHQSGNHTGGKITRLVSFPVCQQVEARSDLSYHTHEITADILPQTTDTSHRQSHNPKRAARTAGIGHGEHAAESPPSQVTSQPSLRIVLWNKLRSFPKRRFHVSPQAALTTV